MNPRTPSENERESASSPAGAVEGGERKLSPARRILARPLPALTVACLIGGLVALLLGIPHCGLPGQDDAIHAVAALRMAEAFESLSWGAFFEEFVYPYKYPPLGRLALALGFLFDGDGWMAPRAASAVGWIITIGLAALLARRVAVSGTGDAAAFWTVVFGLSCWLGVFVARTPLLEVWSTLAAVAGCLVYLRARERRSRYWAVLTGVCIVAAILVKYAYGPLLLGAIGLSALIDVARPGPNRETLRLWPWTLGTTVIGLLWWFVLPFPAGPATGAAHWSRLLDFFGDSTRMPSLGPEYMIVVWALMSCISLPAAACQLAGLVWGIGRWRQPAARICATITMAGFAIWIVFPYRLERCLLPSLFGGWVLGGALCAWVLGRVPRPRRVLAAGSMLIVLLGTAGFGSVTLARLTMRGPWTEVRRESVERAAADWARPYAVRGAPAAPPPGTQHLLDRAADHLDAHSPFGMVGAFRGMFSCELMQWHLFRKAGDPVVLYPREGFAPQSDRESESSFRLWADRFPQILSLAPANPGKNPKGFSELTSWMEHHPRFEVIAREPIVMGKRPREFILTLYTRSP